MSLVDLRLNKFQKLIYKKLLLARIENIKKKAIKDIESQELNIKRYC